MGETPSLVTSMSYNYPTIKAKATLSWRGSQKIAYYHRDIGVISVLIIVGQNHIWYKVEITLANDSVPELNLLPWMSFDWTSFPIFASQLHPKVSGSQESDLSHMVLHTLFLISKVIHLLRTIWANLDYSHEKAWIFTPSISYCLGLQVFKSYQSSPTRNIVFIRSGDDLWLLTKFESSDFIPLTSHSFYLRDFSCATALTQVLSNLEVGQD
jgi:hypothetical protein